MILDFVGSTKKREREKDANLDPIMLFLYEFDVKPEIGNSGCSPNPINYAIALVLYNIFFSQSISLHRFLN